MAAFPVNLSIVCENLPPLFNQYGLIIVDSSINRNLDEIERIYNWSKNNEKIIDRVGVTLASDIKNPLNRKSLYKSLP